MKVVFIIVLIFFPYYLFGQDYNEEKDFSINLQVGYIFPQTPSINKGGLNGGFAIRPSVHYKVSNAITIFTEYNFSKHKYSDTINTHYENHHIFNLGLRIYPVKIELLYFKTALGLFYTKSTDDYYSPMFNLGIGNDFKVNKNIDLFAEVEMMINIGLLRPTYSLSAGIKFKIF